MSIVSMNQFAKMQGVSAEAVRVALQSGRISAHHIEKRGKKAFTYLDSDQCRELWLQNTNSMQRRRPTKGERSSTGAPRCTSKQAGPSTAATELPPPEPTATENQNTEYLSARARKETAEAAAAEMKTKLMLGEYVPLDRVRIAFTNFTASIQQNMMSIPSRLSALIVGEYRTQLSLLAEKICTGVSVTKEDVTKWIDTISDDKIVSDILMAEIKKILTELSNAKIN